MGTISVTNVETNDAINKALFNSRFGTIVDEINGNLDSDNLADNAVITSKIANDAVTDEKVDWTDMTGTDYDSDITNQSSVSSSTVDVRLMSNFLWICMSITLNTSVDDASTDLVQLDLSAMGISSLFQTYTCGFADGGNAITMLQVTTAGMVKSVGNEPVGLNSGDVIQFALAVPVQTWA